MLSLREVKRPIPGLPAGPGAGPHGGGGGSSHWPASPTTLLTAGQVLPLSFLCECYRTSELARLAEAPHGARGSE